ncbi:MAG: hypothetical protein KY476_10265 [Planctomycetes bacterium]|nr:hypothetical protein [Planctomycetota bacterium]
MCDFSHPPQFMRSAASQYLPTRPSLALTWLLSSALVVQAAAGSAAGSTLAAPVRLAQECEASGNLPVEELPGEREEARSVEAAHRLREHRSCEAHTAASALAGRLYSASRPAPGPLSLLVRPICGGAGCPLRC